MGFETAAFSCETLVFLFLGIGIFAFRHPFKESMYLVILTIVILNVSRFFNVGITSLIVNCFRKKNDKINFRVQFVLWVSGLRGAMAYALAMRATIDFDTGALMLVDTLIYALISVLGIGSILSPVLNCAKVKQED